MIIVLDANVIVAAFATRGLCSDLFKFCISRHKIAVSQSLLNEIREILIKKIKLPLGEANAVSGTCYPSVLTFQRKVFQTSHK